MEGRRFSFPFLKGNSGEEGKYELTGMKEGFKSAPGISTDHLSSEYSLVYAHGVLAPALFQEASSRNRFRGMVMVKEVSRWGMLETVMAPSCASTARFTMERPRPVPLISEEWWVSTR